MAKQILNDVNVETINIGNIFPSNQYGEFKIIDKYNDINNGGRIRFTIRFIKTGTEKTNISPQQIREGTIRDEYYPIYYGVACMGNITKREYTNGPTRREYSIWRNFIRRCYDPEDQDYKTYGALGVKVCDRWLCFENFYNDLPNIHGYNEWLNNKGKYDLDKDYLQQNIPHSQKVYSPTTCIFISKSNNNFQRAIDHSNTGYVGVYQLYDNSYTAFINTKSGTVNLGTYSSLEAAINARNR